MEYTIQKLSQLAGISTRTLRFYDEIGLLKPCRVNSSGYRIYGEDEVDMLQQILFFRELGFGLKEIGPIIHSPSFDRLQALREHLSSLRERQDRLDRLIETVRQTIRKEEGRSVMTDKEKFAGWKKEQIAKNEAQYGQEIREKYGEEVIKESYRKFQKLSPAQYEKMEGLEAEIRTGLEEAVVAGADPAGEAGQKLAFTWPQYIPKAHYGLVQMYVADERFTAYYDQKVSGCAAFLKEAVEAFLGESIN